jgi:hypothetical protein
MGDSECPKRCTGAARVCAAMISIRIALTATPRDEGLFTNWILFGINFYRQLVYIVPVIGAPVKSGGQSEPRNRPHNAYLTGVSPSFRKLNVRQSLIPHR